GRNTPAIKVEATKAPAREAVEQQVRLHQVSEADHLRNGPLVLEIALPGLNTGERLCCHRPGRNSVTRYRSPCASTGPSKENVGFVPGRFRLNADQPGALDKVVAHPECKDRAGPVAALTVKRVAYDILEVCLCQQTVH